MRTIARDDLRGLMGPPRGPCVSIYLPTHRPAAHTEQDRIRFKNLLGLAQERLMQIGVRAPAARDLVAPGRALLDDSQFWRHQGDGLAAFLAEGQVRNYRLPARVEELVVVGDRFHIKPLLPVLSGDGRFYVLALSQKEVRLLEGTRHTVSEVDLEGVPQSLADALRFDQPEKQLQWHTRAAPRGGERAAMFHGQGVGTDDAKDRILRYFRAVDAGLRDFLRDEQAPLVLAGVDYYFPIYREANTYPHLLAEGAPGNPEGLRPEELHRQAWEIVRPHFEKDRQGAVARYLQFAGTGRTSASIREVLPAAFHGRVDTLLVCPDVQLWGTFDPAEGRADAHAEARPGDEDLLDLAVLHTLSNSGRVYPANRAQLPNGHEVAALFRY